MSALHLSTPQLWLWLLLIAGALVLATWVYLWLFHYRFWTTRIPPVGNPRTSGCGLATGSTPTPADLPQQTASPAVLVVVPARNEAEVIARTVADILGQDYVGRLHLVVVNDNSQDDTAAIAQNSADATLATLPPELASQRRFSVINGSPLPSGWSGKLWAVEQGVRHGLGADYCNPPASATAAAALSTSNPAAAAHQHTHPVSATSVNAPTAAAAAPTNAPAAVAAPATAAAAAALTNAATAPTNAPAAAICTDAASVCPAAPPSATADAGAFGYVWLTDADISHEPQVLRELTERARSDNRAMVSRMALLCTDTKAERWTIPAFVYFFQMLYPFAAIAEEKSGIHGAAGGCILLEQQALVKIGGIGSLRGALIDDCTLASHVARSGGSLYLELTRSSVSQRGYGGGRGVSDMIARTAYTQLRYSPLRLLGTVFGLFFTFFAPLLLPLAAAALLATAPASPVDSSARPAHEPQQHQPPPQHHSEPPHTHSEPSYPHSEPAPPLLSADLPLLPAALAIGAPLAAALVMFGTFIPMLRFYRLSPLRALALPLIALFYLDATLRSAVRHYRGKTGNWKGRVYQNG